jgi:hypothetical protein
VDANKKKERKTVNPQNNHTFDEYKMRNSVSQETKLVSFQASKDKEKEGEVVKGDYLNDGNGKQAIRTENPVENHSHTSNSRRIEPNIIDNANLTQNTQITRIGRENLPQSNNFLKNDKR